VKPLAFNLQGAKKVATDKTSSTFDLKNGHQIKVAHSALSPEHKKMIAKLPLHAADGADISDITGEGESSSEGTPDTAAPVSTPPTTSMAQDIGNGVRTALDYGSDVGPMGMIKGAWNLANSPTVQTDISDFVKGVKGDNTPSANIPDADPNIPGAGTLVGGQTPSNQSTAQTPITSPVDVNKAYEQGQQAITETQNNQAAYAKSQADIQQKEVADREDLQKTFQQNTQDFQDQQKQFMNDYMNNHIDPNHYLENMNTGQKIATGIGLFLGGWSSAYTHQGNPALDYLNKQIDRDIQGQQNRIDQQKTLLGANQALYHDQLLGNNATRINMNDIYDHKIQLAANNLGTPMAKAAADAAHAQFALSNSQLLQQNAIRATALQSINNNGGGGLDPATLGMAGIIPQADATKEQSAYLAKKAAIVSGNTAYEDAANQTVAQKANPLNWHTAAALGVDQSTLANNLVAVAPTKRYSVDMATALVQPFIPYRTDTPATLQIKKQGYMNLIERESAGEMPLSSKYIKNLQTPAPTDQGQATHKIGDIVYTNGQKGQVINAKGDIKAVK